jgi:hypothetical protein
MTDKPGAMKRDSHDESNATSIVELRNQLNRAYLSGDGAAVERVLALMAATQDDTRAEASKAA